MSHSVDELSKMDHVLGDEANDVAGDSNVLRDVLMNVSHVVWLSCTGG